MIDFIIVAILAVVVAAAARYIYKAKKSGAKCIGCTGGDCGGCCGASGFPGNSAKSCGCGNSDTK